MIEIDTRDTDILDTILEYVNGSEEIQQYWDCANVVAVDRLGYNDHSDKHVEIVANKALRLLRLLDGEKEPGVVSEYDMSREDAEVVVLMAALFHDVGHIVHRHDHSEYSIVLANELIDDLLDELDRYDDREQIIMKAEILHAIKSHHRTAEPLTLEAGILRVADALDMEKGRAHGPHDIHAVSALSVDTVSIRRNDEDKQDCCPVLVHIALNNSSGIFQVDELFKQKISGSGLEDLIRLRAEVNGDEKQIIDTYEL